MKKLSYLDYQTGEYVTLECEYKDDMKCNLISQMLRSEKMSGIRKRILSIFNEMLLQEKIDTKELLEYMKEQEDKEQLAHIIQVSTCFFEMFEYKEKRVLSPEEYTLASMFAFKQNSFGKEKAKDLIIGGYNGQMFHMIHYSPRNQKNKDQEKHSKIIKLQDRIKHA